MHQPPSDVGMCLICGVAYVYRSHLQFDTASFKWNWLLPLFWIISVEYLDELSDQFNLVSSWTVLTEMFYSPPVIDVISTNRHLIMLYSTHWNPVRMDALSQTTFSYTFFWMKCVNFADVSSPNVSIGNSPALVQIMAWRRISNKPLSEPMMVSLPTHICLTRLQWVMVILI